MNRLQIFNIINSQLSLTDFYNIIECQDLLFCYSAIFIILDHN